MVVLSNQSESESNDFDPKKRTISATAIKKDRHKPVCWKLFANMSLI